MSMYCDFYSLPGQTELVESFINAILEEACPYTATSFQTMYIGGGTPSLLGATNLLKLLDGLRKTFDFTGLVEATIEVNPESASREFLEAARDTGINRVSFGVQSLNDNELQSVGRIHTSNQAVDAIKRARDIGFKSISADLIIGLPGQTWNSLSLSLETLIGMGVKHISAYCLSLEEGTALAESPPDNLPSDDTQAELFELTRKLLMSRGFIHYEISNFALKGCESLHNINYWHGGEYLGLGPAASSHINGYRIRNRADLYAYLVNPTGQVEYTEYLDIEKKIAEEAMLRLRLLMEGIEPEELARRFDAGSVQKLIRKLDNMVASGLLVRETSRYVIPSSRILTSNRIFQEVLEH
jgi:oxygen-independent coproporphyrinogen-3 oxidase